MKASYLFLFFLLATTTLANSTPPKNTPSNLQFDSSSFSLIAKGIFEGMSFVESWDQLAPCVTSTEDAIQNIITAVEDLRKQDAIDIARGLIALAKAIEDLPTSIKSCGASITGIERLITSIQALINPATFVYVVSKNLIINGADIYNEIGTAVTDFEAGSWELFGYNVGEALAQIFLHTANPMGLKGSMAENVLVFFKGVAQGISTDLSYNELAPCINEASTIGTVLNQAVSDFITEETSKVIEGVMLLAKVLRSVPEAVKECSVAYTQFDQLLQAIALLEDPRVMVYHIAKSLMVHGQEIWDEITDAVYHIKKGEYETAGQDIGTIIANFIKPDDAVSGKRFTNLLARTAPFEVNHNHKFVNWTIGELKTLFGTKFEDKSQSKIPIENSKILDENLPQNFSSWTQWPDCEHDILDQAKCGSCWAFGAAETLSDRFCIASNGTVNVQLSPQYLVSCSTGNLGCNGGILTLAWASLERSGLPTLECEPYESQEGDAPACSTLEQGCKDGTPLKRYFAKSWSTRWYMSTESIKAEIFKNGPIESAFTVYEDFMAYAGGVYKHTSGAALGGHAIKIVGWGNEDGQDYWLVANSWGTDWGMQGYFKMAIGDSAMDGNGIAGQADVEHAPVKSNVGIRLARNFLADVVYI